jgi:pimeloyl-ACP methyl ester carboxylesterase
MLTKALVLALALQSPDTARTGSGLWYSVQGTGPDVLFIHGSNLDSRSWGALPGNLAVAQRVIVMELRSHGRSADATGSFSWLDDVIEVLDATRSTTAVLIGHSLGAQTALDVAMNAPARVRGLVLIGPAISGHPMKAMPAGIEPMIAALRAGDFDKAGVALAAMPVMRLERDTTRQAAVSTIVRQNVRIFRASPQWIRPAPIKASERLESLDKPLLVLMGAEDPTESNDAGALLMARVPRAAGETIARCGHLLPLDCASETKRAIVEFLARLP